MKPILLFFLGLVLFCAIPLVSAEFEWPPTFRPGGLETNGTHLFMLETLTSDAVYVFNLSNVAYFGNWSVFRGASNEGPRGICFDETDFWISYYVTENVSRYNSNYTYVSSWDTNALNDNPRGMVCNSTYIWILDYTDKVFYRYLANTTLDIMFINLTNYGSSYNYDVAWNSTFFWFVNPATDKVYTFNSSGDYISEFSIVAKSGDSRGIAYADGYLYIADEVDEAVYKYYVNGTFADYFNYSGILSGEATLGWSSSDSSVWTGPFLSIGRVLRSDDPFFYWNPDYWLKLKQSLNDLLSGSALSEFPNNLYSFSVFFLNYLLRQPASLGGI